MQWGNTTGIHFEGWVEMVVQVSEAEIPQIKLPFTIKSKKLSQPILALNAIKVLAQLVSNTEAITKLFQTLFQSLSTKELENLVNLIQKTYKSVEKQTWVKSITKGQCHFKVVKLM